MRRAPDWKRTARSVHFHKESRTRAEDDGGPPLLSPAHARAAVRARRRRSIAKAISWRIVGSLDTLFLSFMVLTFLGPVFGVEARSHAQNAQAASFIALTELATKILLYYAHERLWDRLPWGLRRDALGRPHEGRSRSVAKTASWRVLASVDTVLLALIFTGNFAAAASIGVFEVTTKIFPLLRARARLEQGRLVVGLKPMLNPP